MDRRSSCREAGTSFKVEPKAMNSLRSILICASIALCHGLAWAAPVGGGFEPPRTPDGHVNLEGMWNSFNLTPLERPREFTSLIMSAEDARRAQERWIASRNDMSVPGDPTDANDLVIEPIRGELHTSVIIDPAVGRIPANDHLRELVRKFRADLMTAFDHPEQRPVGERCLASSAGNAPMMTLPANNLHQIVQTADAIVVAAESMHETRVIRMNARHAPASVTAMTGDSIGWWEDDTLVVETRNYKRGTAIGSATYLFYLSGSSTVTERFTLLGPDELGYVFTIDDPTYYTRPWTGETRFRRSSEQMFEYACHEGNYAVLFMLQGARAREAAANTNAEARGKAEAPRAVGSSRLPP
jgi:hypothetical protein